MRYQGVELMLTQLFDWSNRQLKEIAGRELCCYRFAGFASVVLVVVDQRVSPDIQACA
jgi:hypothetical protein